jgi:FixJ family two-component response regulator
LVPNVHTPTVFLVDADVQALNVHALLLRADGLRTAAFRSAEDFLACHDPSHPGCLVLDVGLPGLDGLGLQRQLADMRPMRTIVFLTGLGNIPMSVQAIKAGAVDFLTKPASGEVLLTAVRAALAEDAQAREAWARDESLHHRLANLSGREREILQRLVDGKLNKQIAADLGIAEVTVKFHRSRLMERMQAKTVAELMHAAARLDFIVPRASAGAALTGTRNSF